MRMEVGEEEIGAWQKTPLNQLSDAVHAAHEFEA